MARSLAAPAASRITLRLVGNTWVAEYYGHLATRMRELFGISDIPTCFTSQSTAYAVQDFVQRNHPGVPVTLG